ncbi:MAG: IS5 family transposase [Cyanobacteriota bacterium]|nr:IS5 family transposase [Cyanobacteriota bacterium]
MSLLVLDDYKWQKILAFLRTEDKVNIGKEKGCKQFIEAVLWMSRSGSPWRYLPKEYGKWYTIYQSSHRWSRFGVWERMFKHFIKDPDLGHVIIDLTTVRAHSCAAGKKGEQTLGRSLGGYSSKTHGSLDGLGNPLVFRIIGGERHNITQAEKWIDEWQEETTKVIGDKGYNSNKLIGQIGETQAIIPSKKDRKIERAYDKHLYSERHLIECFFHKLKQYRHLFSGFGKLARNFLSFLYSFGSPFWLKYSHSQ